MDWEESPLVGAAVAGPDTLRPLLPPKLAGTVTALVPAAQNNAMPACCIGTPGGAQQWQRYLSARVAGGDFLKFTILSARTFPRVGLTGCWQGVIPNTATLALQE